MPTRDPRLESALSAWRVAEARSIEDLRSARLAAGLTRDELGRAIGLSADRIGRLERGELADIGLGLVWRLSAGLGLEPSLRLYPADDPVRDAGQVRLLERFRARLPAGVTFRTEVPLHGRSDRRAWDTVLDIPDCRDAVEAESRLKDLQALTRRIGLKRRDDPTIGHVMLLVSDTRANRAALLAGRELLRADYPLDTRAALLAFSAGRCPGAGAVIVI